MARCSWGFRRLSYPVTENLSAKQTVVGIIVLSLLYTGLGFVYGLWKGVIPLCVAQISDNFIINYNNHSPPYLGKFLNETNVSCLASTVTIGEMLYEPQLTYIVSSGLSNYRGEYLNCSIKRRGLTINLISVQSPQFVWDYKISCDQLVGTCGTTCPALNLTIQAFSTVSSELNTTAVADLRANLTDMLGGDKADNCFGEDITVLRFAEAGGNGVMQTVKDFAFTRSQKCDPVPSNATQVLTLARKSVESAMAQDLHIGFGDFTLDRNYLCQVCTSQYDKPWKIALDVATGLTSVGTFCYTAVIWILSRVARRRATATHALSHPLSA